MAARRTDGMGLFITRSVCKERGKREEIPIALVKRFLGACARGNTGQDNGEAGCKRLMEGT